MDRPLAYCNEDRYLPDDTKDYEVMRDKDRNADTVETEQVAWIWCLIFAYIIPEAQSFLRAARVLLMKHWAKPTLLEFAFVAFMECAGAAGAALLVFHSLPQLDSTHGMALTNCLCLVPGILCAMSRKPGETNWHVKLGLDVVAILIQISGILVSVDTAHFDQVSSKFSFCFIDLAYSRHD